MKELLKILEERVEVLANEPMARHTSIQVGGPADYYVTAKTAAQLAWICQAAWRCDVPFFVFGNGTNLLVRDGGIRGLVVENRASRVRGLKDSAAWASDTISIFVESGTPLRGLAMRTAKAGWQGLEWAAGIPGTVGGAVLSNAGAHGGCIANVFQSGRVVCANAANVQEWQPEAFGFTYRRSVLHAETGRRAPSTIVLGVTLSLQCCEAPTLLARIEKYLGWRRRNQPQLPSAGSVFKNPGRLGAGALIQQVGLKGERRGDAQFSPEHANFIVNLGGAKAADIEALMGLARQRVKDSFGLELELEVQIVGEVA